MRLISPFNDHYDVYLRDGDLTTTWERVTQTVISDENRVHPVSNEIRRQKRAAFRHAFQMLEEMPDFELTYEDSCTHFRHSDRLGKCVVSVAGKLYGFYLDSEYRNTNLTELTPVWSGRFYEAAEKFFIVDKSENFKRTSWPNRDKYTKLFAENEYAQCAAGLVEWESKWLELKISPESHIIANSPIYIVMGECVVANPNLAAFGYFRHFDAYTVAQEIEVYMNNELALQRDPIPKRTDDLIRDAHGFDKYSFRNTRPDRRERKSR